MLIILTFKVHSEASKKATKKIIKTSQGPKRAKVDDKKYSNIHKMRYLRRDHILDILFIRLLSVIFILL